MNMQTLRYVVQVSAIGSINKAAQQLYVSQSTLSRAIHEIEESTGLMIFQRTNKGVVPTHEGSVFLEKAMKLLNDVDQLQSQFFINKVHNESELSLLIGTQRSYPVIVAYLRFYKKYCTDKEYLNLVLREGTRDEIINLIYGQILNLGVIHFLSNEAENILKECKSMGLNVEIIHTSPVCAQVRDRHPLAEESAVTLEKLREYPRIAFLGEDVTGINYCSNVQQYDKNILKRRIVVQDRGTHREVLMNTEGYYIGNYYDINSMSVQELNISTVIKCVPITGIESEIKTALIHREGQKLSATEEDFVYILKGMF